MTVPIIARFEQALIREQEAVRIKYLNVRCLMESKHPYAPVLNEYAHLAASSATLNRDDLFFLIDYKRSAKVPVIINYTKIARSHGWFWKDRVWQRKKGRELFKTAKRLCEIMEYI